MSPRARGLLVVAAVATGGVLTWLFLRPSAGEVLQQEIARLDALGEPTAADAFRAELPQVPDNGAAALTAAVWAYVAAHPAGPPPLEPRAWHEHVTPAEAERFLAHVAETRAAFDAMRDACASEVLRFDIDAPSRQVLAALWAERLLRQRLIAVRVAGRPAAERFDALRDAFRFALRWEPLIQTEIMRSSGTRYSLSTFVRAMAQEGDLDSERAHAELDADLRRELLAAWTPAARYHRAQDIDRARRTLDGSRARAVGDRLAETASIPRTLRLADEAVQIDARSHRDLWRGACAVQADLLLVPLPARMRPHSSIAEVAAMTAHQIIRADTCTRLTRVSIALLRHRDRNGDFPQSLDALDSDLLAPIPLDPFTDRPFRYRRTTHGAALASAAEFGDDLPAATVPDHERPYYTWHLPSGRVSSSGSR